MHTSLSASAKILFIADVHLGAFSEQQNRQIENDLIALIDYADQHQYKIALLGDVFDYWIEYPDFTPDLGKQLLQRFRAFNQKNDSAIFITGNHDNWTLGHFSKLGFSVEPNYHLLHIQDKEILLLHGDATGDSIEQLERPFLHQLIRSKYFLKCYRALLPPKIGLKVMQQFSRMTRLLSGGDEDTDFLNIWAKKMLNQSDIDYIICGHDHIPRNILYDGGTFLNTGSFYNKRSLVAYNNGRFQLVNWSKSHQLIPFQNPSSLK